MQIIWGLQYIDKEIQFSKNKIHKCELKDHNKKSKPL